MNPLDIVIAAFVLIPALLGVWRGMLWQIAVIVGLVGGAVGAVLFGPPLGSLLMPGSGWGELGMAAAVFVGVFIVVQLARWALRRLLAAIGLKWIDHLAGGLAAGACGAIAGAWLIMVLPLLLSEKPSVYERSLLLVHAEELACATGFPCSEDDHLEMRFDPSSLPGLPSNPWGFSLGHEPPGSDETTNGSIEPEE